MGAPLPEASTLDVVPDQLPLVLHPEPLLHEDDPVLEDDDVREVKSVGDVVGKEPLPNVLWALVFAEEEPVLVIILWMTYKILVDNNILQKRNKSILFLALVD